MSDFPFMPATRDADGNVTLHPEEVEVTPVDETLFHLITRGDRFADGTGVACGFHAALFVSAGRFVSLCPFCTVGRKVPAECRAPLDAQRKEIVTPHHAYSTEGPPGAGADG